MQTSVSQGILGQGYQGLTPSWLYKEEPKPESEVLPMKAKCVSSDCCATIEDFISDNPIGKETTFVWLEKQEVWICSQCGNDLDEEVNPCNL